MNPPAQISERARLGEHTDTERRAALARIAARRAELLGEVQA